MSHTCECVYTGWTWDMRMCIHTHSHVYTNVEHDTFICFMSHVWAWHVTHMNMWHGTFICVTWSILFYEYASGHTYVYVTCSLICVTCTLICVTCSILSVTWIILIRVCDMAHPWLIHVCDMTHSWLIHVCDMTHSHVWHDTLAGVTWSIQINDLKQLLMCATWRIHTCGMMHSHVCVTRLIYVTWRIHTNEFAWCMAGRRNPVVVTHFVK